MAPPLILKFPSGIGKSIVVPAHDGYLYIVDGVSGCVFEPEGGCVREVETETREEGGRVHGRSRHASTPLKASARVWSYRR
eukprot:879481-Rhodomonas_salina.4